MTNCANDLPEWPDERYLIKVISYAVGGSR
jgi:hypothetical protein